MYKPFLNPGGDQNDTAEGRVRPPPPKGWAGAHPDADVDELANLLMAWYYAGYYTGQYSKRGGGEDAGAAEEGTY